MRNINILDCTLRDGGYVNNWSFSDHTASNLIDSLIQAKIEFIELGYISEKSDKCRDTTMFSNVECIDNIITDYSANYLVMMNLGDFNIDNIEYNPNIFGIRLAFRKEDWRKALLEAEKIINKGFKVFVQPMVALSYTEEELLEVINEFNKLDIYAFYIVDSFGSMQNHDILRLASLVDNNLNSNVKLGLHAHNNLQLAFSNAITLVQTIENRDLIIDSSVLGMGRGAGNLNTELFANHLIRNCDKKYEIQPLLDIIDTSLNVIHKENYWGYSPAHYISAIYNCHPNYSTYLANKEDLTAKDMENIIKNIFEEKKHKFDKNYIERLYSQYMSQKYMDYNYELLNKVIQG
ncbi:hypothetical protein CPAST_c12010 [Clostridium pasteurianum DSM 525 = ATCC 6013]|uniref:Pyruvate carboxyltransferase n=1 Tax=Clostridium pasteurianum DSM 525 = ATCC 6013 TaxID=1262449 RepID=A0A0H3J0D6_CLOPA|nr:aldolase catalytic domain-containing protein [Clostridium pasteurianum]AJA47301.1 hypothetical protein CPAST_c12010 [Clostridium pasteurianum DSM 525 = ATCC 6013]AJA51289.1 hypothetical protein CLPA_c12010 [Clostridium pasteurianum DSM 525 = ATCC 6013]AOZ74641.1 homocitrate synthase [Clostridium pasteurianum DSM 525 = ATCC 6013]AOZ78438.1 homocitrate synthase [Clostridium pasteurianum]ELP57501.1 hypothetical protein F502_19151 [Clostridium pasteurianum DSM 525 = ATCC 6013]